MLVARSQKEGEMRILFNVPRIPILKDGKNSGNR